MTSSVWQRQARSEQRRRQAVASVDRGEGATDAPSWQPLPGPQQAAYESAADVLGYGGAGGGGKALSIWTLIPTPGGPVPMFALDVGDQVFGADGKVYNVIGSSDVMHGHRVFDVVFDDGTVIRADADHRWHTFTAADRDALWRRSDARRADRRAKRVSRGTGKRPDLAERNRRQAATYAPEVVMGGVRTTLEISDTLLTCNGRQTNHAVRVSAPLQMPERDLPVDPYVLGFWLGDGASAHGRVTIGNAYIDDARAALAESGATITKIPSEPYGYTVRGVQPCLRAIGVLKNKHIPESYLLASVEQRRALLCGLMDTDGYATKSGQCEFYSSSNVLIRGVSRLLHTLGIKHAIRVKKPPQGTIYQESYRIKFVSPFPAFRLSAKVSRQNLEVRDTQRWRYIVDVREVESEPVKCIAVDSPDHLYLAGEACVPTHNTDLALGLAGTQHAKSVIFRREFPQLRDVIERSREIFARGVDIHARDSYNEQLHLWRLSDGRLIELAACQMEKHKEKQRGRPRDLYVFDEATQFTESQVRFIIGWNRTTRPGQRCRVVLCFNPPTDEAGRWVIRYFLPWMAYLFPGLPECEGYTGTPAAPGELRWFAMVDGAEVEVPAGTPKARSRTFLPARVEDNPYLMEQGYDATLEAMPEPLRSQMRYGDFAAGAGEVNPWQIIPSDWIAAAQSRWRPDGQIAPCSGVGLDVARGGSDQTTVARVYGSWVAPLLCVPGAKTPDGGSSAALVLDDAMAGLPVGVDLIGVGASSYDHLVGLGLTSVVGVNASSRAVDSRGRPFTDRSGKLTSRNIRAAMWWMLREALDPSGPNPLALPPDPQLAADLRAPMWSLTSGGVLVEEKKDVKRRIGRSPDRADALAHALIAPHLIRRPPTPVQPPDMSGTSKWSQP